MTRKYGNAQTIGSRMNQTTYFIIKQADDCMLAVLADGTVDCVTGAYGAVLACETAARRFDPAQRLPEQLDGLFAETAAVLQERMYLGRKPRISLLTACFREDRMYYRKIGEMEVWQLRHGEALEAEETGGVLTMREGAVLLCSAGVHQALSPMEIGACLAGRGHPYKRAQRLIEAVNGKNLKEQKSTVLLVVK